MVVIKNISGNTFKMFICIIGLGGKPGNRIRLRSHSIFLSELFFDLCDHDLIPKCHPFLSLEMHSHQPMETHLQFIVYLSHLITPVRDLSSPSQTTSCWLLFPSPLLYLLWNLLSMPSVIEHKMSLVLRILSILEFYHAFPNIPMVHSFHSWMLPG